MNTLSPEQQLRNVARVVRQLTERTNAAGRKSRQRYVGDTNAIAGAARQLAEMVEAYLSGELKAEEHHDEYPF